MSRKLSLSQAARIMGVTRKQIQEKVLQEELIVMEGTVTMDDLRKAYPDHEFEDNAVVERMQKIMSDAVHKMAQDERDGARLEALSKRSYALNKALAEQKAKADFYEELINRLKQRFVEISSHQVDKTEIIELQKWLLAETSDVYLTIDGSSNELLEQQIVEFMQPHIRLLPSRHDFTADKSDTILESALHSGLAVDYGCNNGKCGKCKMKLISGKVEKVKNTDYVLSSEEKADHVILSCSHKPMTDLVLETAEAVSVEDIPKQTIVTKVKSFELINDKVYILNLKTPRSQRLRFLAGQEIKLTMKHQGEEISTQLAISSCPCDDMNLQFHSAVLSEDKFFESLSQTSAKKKTIRLDGPSGHFTLDEESPRAQIFIAVDHGFAQLKSLIEHSLALDMEEHIHLFWVADSDESFYMKNICRSWNDALDNFHLHLINCNDNCAHHIGDISQSIIETIEGCDQFNNFVYYISASTAMIRIITDKLIDKGCNKDQIHYKAYQSIV